MTRQVRPRRGAHAAQGRAKSHNSEPAYRSNRRPAPNARKPLPANGRPHDTQIPTRHRTNSALVVIIAIVSIVVIGVGGFFAFRHFTTKHLVIDGQQVTVARNATPRMLVEQEVVAAPKPGNLMAVDGSLLSKGDGDICSATADGSPVGVDEEIPADTTVQIGDGADVTEDYDEEKEAIPFEKDAGNREFEAYWYGSIHLLSEGEDGVKSTKTGRKSGITVEEVIKPAVDAGYVIYSAKPEDKVIALTFDDGPWPESTDAILDLLEQYDAKATFFTIGNQIEGNEDVIKREAELGCEVLTHTWDHAAGSGQGVSIGYMSAAEQVQEIEKGYEAIADVLGKEPEHIIRAPGGNFNGDTIENLWDYVDAEIGWDVDTEDWSRPGVDSIVKMIMSATPGNVILMHDGGGDRSQTVAALEQALPQLVEDGYKFITVSELLEYGMPAK